MLSLSSVTKVVICRMIWSTVHYDFLKESICLTCIVLPEFLYKTCSLPEPEIKAEHASPETREGGSGESHLVLFHMALLVLQLLPSLKQTFPNLSPSRLLVSWVRCTTLGCAH